MPRYAPPVLKPGSLNSLDQPVLSLGTDAELRPWRLADVPAAIAAYAEPDIGYWNLRTFADEREATEWVQSWHGRWQAETDASWVISDPDGLLLGRILLRDLSLADGTGQLGYWTRSAARGRGLAMRAVCAVTDWAFADLGLHRVELHHSTRNTASCRVATRAGYALEGIKRQHTRHPDGWHDMHWHARVRDFPAV